MRQRSLLRLGLCHRTLTTNSARPFHVLGIETSCDDTCVAVVSSDRTVRAEVIVRQQVLHEPYGGIHPTHAMRSHTRQLPRAIRRALDESGLDVRDMAAVAATRGPGLPASLSAGWMAAKAIAASNAKPLLAVHHMAAHALTARLLHPDLCFPFLCLLTSGGHTLLLDVRNWDDFEQLGTTQDESIGNALDMVAKQLSVPWGTAGSGAAALEQLALRGDPLRVPLPEPLQSMPGYDFSFTGMRTAVSKWIKRHTPTTDLDLADVAASMQSAAVAHVLSRVERAVKHRQRDGSNATRLVVSGGVARNTYFRTQTHALCERVGLPAPIFPPPHLCSDNATMIAWAAIERLLVHPDASDDLTLEHVAKWPLGERRLPTHRDVKARLHALRSLAPE